MVDSSFHGHVVDERYTLCMPNRIVSVLGGTICSRLGLLLEDGRQKLKARGRSIHLRLCRPVGWGLGKEKVVYGKQRGEDVIQFLLQVAEEGDTTLVLR